MRHLGFSTGALARGDFRLALKLLEPYYVEAVELSALRLWEVDDIIESLPSLQLSRYSFVSFHAPSVFPPEDEQALSDLLFRRIPEHWPIVLHPDAITDFGCWKRFGNRLAIENMDRRKHIGRTVNELQAVFRKLPDARLCLDLGHARQFDSTMTEAYFLLVEFQSRLVQLHVSEVNTASQHERISFGAKLGFEYVSQLIPEHVPLILESRVTAEEIGAELAIVSELFSSEKLPA